MFEAEDETTEETTDAPEAEVEETPEAEAAEPKVDPNTLPPKERRKLLRATRDSEARPQRTQEERTADRLARRSAKAAERRRYRPKARAKRKGEGEGTPPAERRGTGSARVLRGTVVSDKADKTITVRIDIARQHRTYGKIVRSTSKVHAHDERNEANAGDTVRVVESRPLSKSKRWRLVDVVERAQ
jgi:small subunit ribosomal protein S17